MPERIIISFDDENSGQGKEENTFNSGFPVKYQIHNSYFRGNEGLSYYTDSPLGFPEGIEKSFRKRFTIKFKDTFLNSILETTEYIILSSTNGNIYFIDRFSCEPADKFALREECFEKTGVVFEDNIYLNSLRNIFVFTQEGNEIKYDKFYSCPDDTLIWSNLNICKGKIVFIEYRQKTNRANVKIIDTKPYKVVNEFLFDSTEFLYDSIIADKGYLYTASDNRIISIDTVNNKSKHFITGERINRELKMFSLQGRLYFTDINNDIKYLDINSSEEFRYTGISSVYLNSCGGFGNLIFLGNDSGWSVYRQNGIHLYTFEDTEENKIESIGQNILAVSKRNKIVMHNLKRFQEAEGFSTGSEEDFPDEIISAVVSYPDILTLTKAGVFEGYRNDKINIHIK